MLMKLTERRIGLVRARGGSEEREFVGHRVDGKAQRYWTFTEVSVRRLVAVAPGPGNGVQRPGAL